MKKRHIALALVGALLLDFTAASVARIFFGPNADSIRSYVAQLSYEPSNQIAYFGCRTYPAFGPYTYSFCAKMVSGKYSPCLDSTVVVSYLGPESFIVSKMVFPVSVGEKMMMHTRIVANLDSDRSICNIRVGE